MYSVIVWMRVELKATVVIVNVVDNLSGSYLQSQSCLLLGVTSLVIELIGPFAVMLLDVYSFFKVH